MNLRLENKKKSKFYQFLCWKIAKFCFKNTNWLSRKIAKLITITCKKCSWFLRVGLNFSPYFYFSKLHMLTPSYVMFPWLMKYWLEEKKLFFFAVMESIKDVWAKLKHMIIIWLHLSTISQIFESEKLHMSSDIQFDFILWLWYYSLLTNLLIVHFSIFTYLFYNDTSLLFEAFLLVNQP